MLVKNYKPGQHNLLLFFSSCKEPPHITCKCKDIFYNACVMDVHLESFSLRNIGKQFREFNSAIKKNHARLSPYFWWVCKSDFVRFNFILSGLVMEKISHVMHDLPYNKKFIKRTAGSGKRGTGHSAATIPKNQSHQKSDRPS